MGDWKKEKTKEIILDMYKANLSFMKRVGSDDAAEYYEHMARSLRTLPKEIVIKAVSEAIKDIEEGNFQ